MSNLTKILGSVIALVLIFTMFAGCERIDAGHVGVKVNLYGDGKGVDDVTEVTGWVFYNPISTKIVEFPTYVQHKEYKLDRENEIDESFVVNSYTADELISNRELFELKVRSVLVKQLEPEGFILSQFTSNLVYPETFKKAIEAKNNAVQAALTAENKVKQAEAEAKIKVATAEGNAQAMLTRAKAEAEANRLRQQTLTPMLIQQQWIEKWKGNVPSTVLGNGTNLMYGIK
jgi:hypothetical protein